MRILGHFQATLQASSVLTIKPLRMSQTPTTGKDLPRVRELFPASEF